MLDGVPEFLKVKNRGKPLPAKGGLVGTYTIINSYRNCPEQMRRRYITKDLGAFVETKEMAWGNAVHAAFELRVGSGKPLPTDMQHWESFAVPFDGYRDGGRWTLMCEQKLGIKSDGTACDFWATDVWFRGKADIIVTSDDRAYIPDLKTGSSKYEDPFELAVNAVLIKAHRPKLKIVVGNYIWLKENRAGEMYDLSDFRETWREMCRLMGEIEADKASGKWEKRKSGLCSWCNVTDCENWRERK